MNFSAMASVESWSGAPESSACSIERSARASSRANLYDATKRPSSSKRWRFTRNLICSSDEGGIHYLLFRFRCEVFGEAIRTAAELSNGRIRLGSEAEQPGDKESLASRIPF